MGDFEVKQRTKDGMFNATELLKQWNKGNPKNRKEKVQLFFNNKGTKDFINVLEEDLNGQKITHLNSRGKNGGTWMHPFLFIKFAMWLNPKFELTVIKFVYDQLIKFRHDAGDNYRLLASSASILNGVDYSKLAKAVNWVVFGKHTKNLRQVASEDQLRELAEIEKQLSFSIDMGMIQNFNGLLALLRKMYNKKYNNAA